MANEQDKKKPGFQFNIIKNDPLDGHKGQNIGSISLENVASIFIDIDTKETFIDIAGLHAKAEVEKKVKWVTDKSEVEGEDAREFWLVWVTVERSEEGPFYSGVTACYEMVNKKKKRGYKLMPEHVNMLDRSMKGEIDLSEMDAECRSSLKEFLEEYRPEMWDNAGELQKTMTND